jgi:hypothetical protein
MAIAPAKAVGNRLLDAVERQHVPRRQDSDPRRQPHRVVGRRWGDEGGRQPCDDPDGYEGHGQNDRQANRRPLPPSPSVHGGDIEAEQHEAQRRPQHGKTACCIDALPDPFHQRGADDRDVTRRI